MLGLAAIVGSAFLAYKFLAKKSVVETIAVGVSENPKVVSYPAQDFQRVAPSSPRGRKRRTHYKISANATTTCPKCGEPVRPHRVCASCGTYKGKEVIKKEEEK